MLKTSKQNKNNSILWAFFLAFFGLVFLLMLFFKRKQKEENLYGEKDVSLVSDLNPRQEKILKILKERKEITIEELMLEIKNVSERTFRRDMKKLEELKFLEKEGNTKGSKYIFTQ